jgi:hypothetical protein
MVSMVNVVGVVGGSVSSSYRSWRAGSAIFFYFLSEGRIVEGTCNVWPMRRREGQAANTLC